MKMTTEEAFVKVLQMHGIEHSFGIIGSAFMPDLRPLPESRHHVLGCAPTRRNGGIICDGFTRARAEKWAWPSPRTAPASPAS